MCCVANYDSARVELYFGKSKKEENKKAFDAVILQKDAIEKGFDDLKNDLDMKRLRIHSNATMEGRIFIQFVSLVLTYLPERHYGKVWLGS